MSIKGLYRKEIPLQVEFIQKNPLLMEMRALYYFNPL